MNLPKHIANIISPAPEGFTWVYRGFGWKSPTDKVRYVIYKDYSLIGMNTILTDYGRANGVDEYEYVELVEFDMTTLQGQLEYAKTLLGKRVKSNRSSDVYSYGSRPEGWEVAGYKFIDLITRETYHNATTKLSLNKGWSVVIWMTNDSSLLPVEFAEVVEPIKYKTIKLTDDYDVVIYKDKVEVGCQTISKEKLCEIMLEMEKL